MDRRLPPSRSTSGPNQPHPLPIFLAYRQTSSSTHQNNEQRALSAGAAAYFQKPADNDELLSGIRTNLANISSEQTRADAAAVLSGAGSVRTSG
jgi:DNA-binding NarL/FixJ family response regulator